MNLPVELGTELRGYHLDSVLGRGGMGCVYEATHTILGRKVAMKLLAPDLAASEEYVSRFMSEARIVNDVRHPNIVDIHDFIQEPGRVAYVMEYVAGPSLGKFLREGPLTVRQAVNLTFQIASALESVHAVGVVHRDLKPDNILVLGSRDSDLGDVPSVKLLDFGIAKSNGADVEHKTVTGSMLGTPAYMAPEQVAGEPVSPATDVYAVCEILYEAISGQRLFRGDNMAILRTKLIGEVPELAWPDVPGWEALDRLVRRGLAVHAQDRLTIAELVLGLSEVLSAQPDAPWNAPRSGAVPAPPAARSQPPETLANADTSANMASVVAPALSRPAGGRGGLVFAGAALFAAAVGLAAFAMRGVDERFVEAAPVAPDVSAVEPAAPAPDPAASPAPVAPAPEEKKAEPEAEPEPEPKKPEKKRRIRRRRPKRRPRTKVVDARPAAPAPTPAPTPKPARVLKKSELPSW